MLEQAIELRKQGYTTQYIADVLNVGRSTVERKLKAAGISTKRVTIKFNANYFDVIDDEFKAYWLGFIFADGYVSDNGKFELTLKADDINHLYKFKDALNSDHKISYKSKQNANRLCICNNHFVNMLIDKGCIPKKSLKLKFPNYLEAELIRHFIRGYFDGDGCIYKNSKKFSISIVGTKDFLEAINFILNTDAKIYKKGNAYQIYFYGDTAKGILSYMYNEANIYLDRKFEKSIAVLDGND